MRQGKYAFETPFSLKRWSRKPCTDSHRLYPYGRTTIVPRTGP